MKAFQSYFWKSSLEMYKDASKRKSGAENKKQKEVCKSDKT